MPDDEQPMRPGGDIYGGLSLDPDEAAMQAAIGPEPPIEGEIRVVGMDGRPVAVEALSAYDAAPFVAASLADIQPIDWVYPGLLPCGYFGALGAVPGAGKSALTVLIAVSVAIGRDLLTGEAIEPRNVWVINLEDPRDHILRMVWAVCEHYRIEPADLEGHLYVDSGRDHPLIMAQLLAGAPVVMPVSAALLRELKARQIGLLTIDPVVDTHALNENDNIHINLVCGLWNNLASQAGCAILLSSHFRKGGVGGDMDSFRGASALIAKSRAAVTLAVMSEEEAGRLGVAPERRRWHIRMDNARYSLSPPAEKARWLRLESVPLPPGDTQALRLWEPPTPWDGLDWPTIDRILAAIQTGPSPGEMFSPNRQSKDRWAGAPIIEAGRSPAQAVAILKTWTDNGVLEAGLYHSPAQRKEMACVSVNPAKAAEMRRNWNLAASRDE